MSSLANSLDDFDHGGYYRPSNDSLDFYCMIPKNASSWVSDLLSHNNWIRSKIADCFSHDPCWSDRARLHQENYVVDNLIVVLRDPVERWVAGIGQYLSTSVLNSHWYDRTQYSEGYSGPFIDYKLNYLGPVVSANEFVNMYNEITERILFGQIAFDDHTQPQSWFVDYFKQNSMIQNYNWFYMNNEFEDSFLSHNPGLNVSMEPDYNRGNDNSEVKLITDFLRQRIKEKPYLKNNLLRFYGQDVELISSVNFLY